MKAIPLPYMASFLLIVCDVSTFKILPRSRSIELHLSSSPLRKNDGRWAEFYASGDRVSLGNGLSPEHDDDTFEFSKRTDSVIGRGSYIDTDEVDIGIEHEMQAMTSVESSISDPIERYLSRAECCVLLWDALGTALVGEKGKLVQHPALSVDDGLSSRLLVHLTFCRELGLVNLYEPQRGADQESLMLLPLPDAVHVEVFEQHPATEAEVLLTARRWVSAMIADFSVCPYTIDDASAGVPKGGIRYSVSDAQSAEEAFRDFWTEVYTLLSAPVGEISTSLVWFPTPLFTNVEYFEKFCLALDDALVEASLSFEDQVQLVYFHPEFKFKDKDGQIYFIFDEDGQVLGLSSDIVEPINYARRSPWPMVNLLRTNQVKELQKTVPEGKVFTENKQRLNAVGSDTLQRMLDEKNWDTLPPHSMKAKLRVQQQRQQQQS